MMNEWFHGWKRKVGVVTLMLSVVLVLGWTSSFRRSDLFTLPAGPLPVGVLVSSHGCLGCTWADQRTTQFSPTWEVTEEKINFSNCGFLFDFQDDKRYWQGVSPRLLIPLFGSVVLPGAQYNGSGLLADAQQVALDDETTPLEIPALLADDASPVAMAESPEIIDRPSNQTEDQQSNVANMTNTLSVSDVATGAVPLTNNNATQQINFTASPVQTRFGILSVPYWLIVSPLTILTLWLLLSKSRASTRLQTLEPVGGSSKQ